MAHCRHCYGDCGGGCLLPGDGGGCIHQPVPKRAVGQRLTLLRTRRFWRRVFFGVRLESGPDNSRRL